MQRKLVLRRREIPLNAPAYDIMVLPSVIEVKDYTPKHRIKRHLQTKLSYVSLNGFFFSTVALKAMNLDIVAAVFDLNFNKVYSLHKKESQYKNRLRIANKQTTFSNHIMVGKTV